MWAEFGKCMQRDAVVDLCATARPQRRAAWKLGCWQCCQRRGLGRSSLYQDLTARIASHDSAQWLWVGRVAWYWGHRVLEDSPAPFLLCEQGSERLFISVALLHKPKLPTDGIKWARWPPRSLPYPTLVSLKAADLRHCYASFAH